MVRELKTQFKTKIFNTFLSSNSSILPIIIKFLPICNQQVLYTPFYMFIRVTAWLKKKKKICSYTLLNMAE